MHAHVGDRLIVTGHHVGEPKRIGRIREVRGPDGDAPYRVEWDATGRTTLLFPGPDCSIEPMDERVEANGHSHEGS